MDEVCPPSTVYGAFNAYDGEKTIVEYHFNNHEGGQGYQEREQMAWLSGLFGVGRRERPSTTFRRRSAPLLGAQSKLQRLSDAPVALRTSILQQHPGIRFEGLPNPAAQRC
ncbi:MULTISPECIES: acetylxylan esterase [unclassified Mesorhizobium]|uniref:acetylxylan esterase n=1 Tax=unclassified Mesorhizobium TaxID=325217 RepID=UPI001FE23D38|nr:MULTISPECIES: acetylxylan esterase [unclassified Mesorhizobium]